MYPEISFIRCLAIKSQVRRLDIIRPGCLHQHIVPSVKVQPTYPWHPNFRNEGAANHLTANAAATTTTSDTHLAASGLEHSLTCHVTCLQPQSKCDAINMCPNTHHTHWVTQVGQCFYVPESTTWKGPYVLSCISYNVCCTIMQAKSLSLPVHACCIHFCVIISGIISAFTW